MREGRESPLRRRGQRILNSFSPSPSTSPIASSAKMLDTSLHLSTAERLPLDRFEYYTMLPLELQAYILTFLPSRTLHKTMGRTNRYYRELIESHTRRRILTLMSSSPWDSRSTADYYKAYYQKRPANVLVFEAQRPIDTLTTKHTLHFSHFSRTETKGKGNSYSSSSTLAHFTFVPIQKSDVRSPSEDSAGTANSSNDRPAPESSGTVPADAPRTSTPGQSYLPNVHANDQGRLTPRTVTSSVPPSPPATANAGPRREHFTDVARPMQWRETSSPSARLVDDEAPTPSVATRASNRGRGAGYEGFNATPPLITGHWSEPIASSSAAYDSDVYDSSEDVAVREAKIRARQLRKPMYRFQLDPLDSFETWILSLTLQRKSESIAAAFRGSTRPLRWEKRVAEGLDRVFRDWFNPNQGNSGEQSRSYGDSALHRAHLIATGPSSHSMPSSTSMGYKSWDKQASREEAEREDQPEPRMLEFDGTSCTMMIQPHAVDSNHPMHPALTSMSSHHYLSNSSQSFHWHACKGDVPPPLVGASVTLVDDGSYLPASSPSSSISTSQGKVYLFGGRLVSTRRMVNDMYILDLTTLHWTRHTASKDDADTVLSSVPQPRYFHSCDIWNGKLIIFGGMGYGKDNDAELCVLNEVIAFDLATQRWELDFQSSASEEDETLSPQPRYAHLSSITAHSLVVIGGQDMGNHYVETINVFDIQKRTWVIAEAFGKQRGGYRSLAVGPTWIVDDHLDVNSRRPSVKTSSASPSSTSNISLLPTSRKGYDEEGKERRLPIYVYTNYNFTDVKREMEMIQLQDKDGKEHITITDQSGPMNGVSLPPGLRFPMGAVLGNYLIISGTYLANTSQTFAIWTLYLPKMTWSRLDVGPLLASGSWNRGLLWANEGRILVFGNRDRDLVSDYNHRQTNWDHVFLIELEAWGITQPPPLAMSSALIQLGLQKLASSMLGSLRHSLPNQRESNAATSLCLGNRGDFEIICSDGMKLGCDRIILEKRWPWFADRMRDYRSTALEESRKVNSKDGLLTNEIKGLILDDSDEEDSDDAKAKAYSIKSDIRITPRQLYMGEPSPVVLALLVYLYTRSFCTSTQRHPAIVAALLVISKVYKMDDLQKWAKHAAHISLSTDLAAPIGSDTSTPTSASPVVSDVHFHLPPLERHRLAVAMYEAATICGLEALQIRALRTVMSIAKWVQRSSILASRNLYDAESTADASYTPTTGALQSDGAVLQQMQRDLSPSSTRMTSPASRKRTSMGRTSVDSYETEEAAAVGTVNMARKLSKAERMLGMSGADVAASSSSPSLMSIQGRGVVDSRLAPIRTRADRANSQSQLLAPYAAPSSVSTRRPSAPGLVTSHPPSSLLHPRSGTTTTDYASSNNRKRFSIFGKASERTAGPDQLLDSPAEEKGNIFDQRSIYRINGDMSTTTETSLASLQGTMSDSSSSNIGLPPPALSEKDMRRIEKGKLSTLNRLKASALKSIDTSYTPYDNVSTSNNGSSISIAKALPAGSQTSTYNSLQSNNRLNDQELKALYSIS